MKLNIKIFILFFIQILAFSAISQEKKNIIFLLADDLRYDGLGCTGNSIVQTPNIDGLAEKGIKFKNAYVTSSICCSSRAAIFSGQFNSRNGINDFSTSFSSEAWKQTYPMVLKNNGYYLGFIGKFGVGNAMPSSDFDYWKGFGGQGTYIHNGQHLTEMMGDQCLEFLDRRDTQKPFCLSVSFKAPHVQEGHPDLFVFDPKLDTFYQNNVIPYPETYPNQYWENFSAYFKTNNEGRNRYQDRFSNPALYQKMVKGYYRLITGIDVVVKRLTQKLDELGLAENTIIIFSSDNGFFLGEHGLAGKWYAHEESVRVPLLIFDPTMNKAKQGAVIDQMALNIDLAPTILSMANVHVPSSMQGRNLQKLINGDTNWREDFYYEHWFSYGGKIKDNEAVIEKSFKYIYYPNSPEDDELYDLAADPFEKVNQADNPEFKTDLDRLKQKLSQKRNEIQVVAGNTLLPIEDAYIVSGKNASTKFGVTTPGYLKVFNDNGDSAFALLRFNRSLIENNSDQVFLNIYGKYPVGSRFGIYASNDLEWEEETVCWNNFNAIKNGEKQVFEMESPILQYHLIDISELIKKTIVGDYKDLTLVIKAENSFASENRFESNPGRLKIEYNDANKKIRAVRKLKQRVSDEGQEFWIRFYMDMDLSVKTNVFQFVLAEKDSWGISGPAGQLIRIGKDYNSDMLGILGASPSGIPAGTANLVTVKVSFSGNSQPDTLRMFINPDFTIEPKNKEADVIYITKELNNGFNAIGIKAEGDVSLTGYFDDLRISRSFSSLFSGDMSDVLAIENFNSADGAWLQGWSGNDEYWSEPWNIITSYKGYDIDNGSITVPVNYWWYSSENKMCPPYLAFGTEAIGQAFNYSTIQKMDVFPNPAQNFIKIVPDDTKLISERINVEILDFYGKTVKQFNEVFANNSMFVGDLVPGAYLVRVKSKNGIHRGSKMLKF